MALDVERLREVGLGGAVAELGHERVLAARAQVVDPKSNSVLAETTTCCGTGGAGGGTLNEAWATVKSTKNGTSPATPLPPGATSGPSRAAR